MIDINDALRASEGSALTQQLRGFRTSFGKFARRQPLGLASAVVLFLLVVVAISADWIAPFDPISNNTGPNLEAPGGANILGTDQFGRDLLSRIIYGARISLYVGLGGTILAGLGATILGATGGYFGGIFDYLTQRVVDVAQAMPSLILLIVMISVVGPSMMNVIIALALLFTLGQSRIIRGATIGLRNSTFVEAAEATGASPARILLRHILPNIFPTVVVLVSTSVGLFIVAEASLSFLGFGVPPPAPSWGGMMSSDGRTYMLLAPWILIAPTVALGLVVFSANMLGDAIRDAVDPRLRGSR